MFANSLFPADSFTFTKVIFGGNPHFFDSVATSEACFGTCQTSIMNLSVFCKKLQHRCVRVC